MDDLKTALRLALVSRFGVKGPLDDDTRLFSSGLIDSLSVMDLVCLVESEIGCAIPPADITLDHFDSVDRILRFTRMLTSAGDEK